MNSTSSNLAVAIGLLPILTLLIPAERSLGQTAAYTVTDVSVQSSDNIPSRINNLGDLVGRSGQSQATLWSRGSLKRKQLGTLSGGEYSAGFAINDAGQVTGASNTPSAIVPFAWDSIGGLQRVPLILGDTCGQGFGINKSGHVVGYSSGRNGSRAFFWSKQSGTHILSPLAGGSYSRARDLNDADQAVGTSDSSAGPRAVLWTNAGQVRDLGTLSGDTASEAFAINNSGDVVGCSTGPKAVRAFLWTAAGGMQDLGTLAGGNSSRAIEINDAGDVVGTSGTQSGDHAFIWRRADGIRDLNTLIPADQGVLLVEAHAINNLGQILAMGKSGHDMTASHGPECAPAPPSTFLLLPASAPTP